MRVGYVILGLYGFNITFGANIHEQHVGRQHRRGLRYGPLAVSYAKTESGPSKYGMNIGYGGYGVGFGHSVGHGVDAWGLSFGGAPDGGPTTLRLKRNPHPGVCYSN